MVVRMCALPLLENDGRQLRLLVVRYYTGQGWGRPRLCRRPVFAEQRRDGRGDLALGRVPHVVAQAAGRRVRTEDRGPDPLGAGDVLTVPRPPAATGAASVISYNFV